MLFVDGIVFIDKTRNGVNIKLDLCRHTLESRCFNLSISKTEYLKCTFSRGEEDKGVVTFGVMTIPKVEKFKYLRLIIQEKGDIDKDIDQYINVG